MLELLKHVLAGQNQFASGGLLLMVLGGIGVFVRSLPERLWSWLLRQTTMMITVKDDDVAFGWVKEWLLEQTFMRHIRQVDLDTTLRGTEIALLPAPGCHLFWHAKRPFWVWFHRSDEAKGRSQRRVESLSLRTLGRDQRFLKMFVDEVLACHHQKMKMVSSLYVYDEYWNCVQAYSPRLIDSVILKPGQKEELIQDFERFRASRERYRRLGVPYHRGYLLYGPPGTGKTSLVSALAAKFGMSIYVINLTEFNDRTLKTAMNDVPANSMILFEDIDCMKAGNRRENGNDAQETSHAEVEKDKSQAPLRFTVTLSGLLNVLDGFQAPENVVYVMTTNQVESLDPALLRPGRIDYRLFMGEASSSQRRELYRRFFPDASNAEATDFVQTHGTRTMAEFQGLLLAMEEEWQTLEARSELLSQEPILAEAFHSETWDR